MSDGEPRQADLLTELRDNRLGAYRAQRSDILEHFNLENEIAQNYQGRLIYELLQNADDAMDEGGLEDRVLIRVTRDALLFANSGREISEQDVRSLCGVSISTKHARKGVRASIGHKGMGFKSVLEITDRPAVYSTGHSFAFDRGQSRELLLERFGPEELPEGGRKVPVMRLPFATNGTPAEVTAILAQGYRTVFCFPFDEGGRAAMAERVATRLKGMSATEILFLRKLEEVRIELPLLGEAFSWQISRDEWRGEVGWQQAGEMARSGVTRVTVQESESTRAFIVFSAGDLEIGDHRVGLDSASWAEVTLTEVSLAIPWKQTGGDGETPAGRLMPFPVEPRVHVFLGTGEFCPFPFLVNGAFNCDLSRRSVRCSDEEQDYNAYLMHEAERLFAEQVLPFAQDQGMSTADLLLLLDAAAVRNQQGDVLVPSSGAAAALRKAVRTHLGQVAFVPCGDRLARLHEVAAFPDLEADPGLGEALRARLPASVRLDEGLLPEAELCRPGTARILRALGSSELLYTRLPKLVAMLEPAQTRLERHPSADIGVDPVLHLVTRLWRAIPAASMEREPFREIVKRLPLFPTGTPDEDGVLPRVATSDLTCFYPPRSLSGRVPLQGICFLSREVCWGSLIPKARNELLQAEMATWQEIWGIRDFKFPEVMRATVMPRLTRDSRPEEQADLKHLDALAAICQLAGRTPDASRPLPFERLGTNRALFQLSRLPVPCRAEDGGVRWVPAFRAYLGRDWIGERSVEPLLEAVTEAEEELPDVPLLMPPTGLIGLLAQFGHVTEDAAGDGSASDEPEPAEDEGEVPWCPTGHGPRRDSRSELEQVRLLVHDGAGHRRFLPARECLYTNRRDCREWLGLNEETLWTFVLEANPAARGPLREYFGVRVLEDEIRWIPRPGDRALDEDGRLAFRRGLSQVGAYLLCMLEVDRSADRLVQRDLSSLRGFIRTVEPVSELWAEWQLPGGLRGKSSRREYLVYKPSSHGDGDGDGDGAGKKPFLLWGEDPWPARLDQRTAVRLASAICDYLEISAVAIRGVQGSVPRAGAGVPPEPGPSRVRHTQPPAERRHRALHRAEILWRGGAHPGDDLERVEGLQHRPGGALLPLPRRKPSRRPARRAALRADHPQPGAAAPGVPHGGAVHAPQGPAPRCVVPASRGAGVAGG